MNSHSTRDYLRTAAFAVLAFVLGLLMPFSGKAKHRGWEPPLEETSTHFLKNQVEEALRLIQAARDETEAPSDRSSIQLVSAARTLQRMAQYYLPLLEAREQAYDAHRLYYYGEKGRAAARLDAVEAILDSIVEATPGLFDELKEPLDLVVETRAAMEGAPDEVPRLLKALAVRLNLLAVKGGLILPSDDAM